MLSHFSHVRLFATLWTVAHLASLSKGFSRQEHWSGWTCPPQGIFPPQRSNPCLLRLLPCRWILYHSCTWEALKTCKCPNFQKGVKCLVLRENSGLKPCFISTYIALLHCLPETSMLQVHYISINNKPKISCFCTL